MKQLDLFEGFNASFESRQVFHKSTMAMVEKCRKLLDGMKEISIAVPVQLPLFKKLFHPGFGRVMEA